MSKPARKGQSQHVIRFDNNNNFNDKPKYNFGKSMETRINQFSMESPL